MSKSVEKNILFFYVKIVDFYELEGYLISNKTKEMKMFGKKQREKLLDGFMGLAYSFAAVSGGVSVYEHNYNGFFRAALALFAMIFIAKLYKED